MKKCAILLTLSLIVVSLSITFADDYDPGPGKTIIIIGQTYKSEYQSYVTGIGKAPGGSSHYGELYHHTLNLGDDTQDAAYLKWISATYPKAYAVIAISIKDNPAKGGYSGENAVWQACRDILTGKWDTNLTGLANGFKAQPNIRFFVRIGYEVSIPMFANKTNQNIIAIFDKYNALGINALERADEIEEFDLDTYRNAFKYVADLFKRNGVTNCAYVFHPVRGFYDAKWLYPGDDVTDWVGISVFNGDICCKTLEANGQLLENCPASQKVDTNLEKLLDWAKDSLQKPIMIAESAVQQPNSNTTAGVKDYLDRVIYLVENWDIRCWTYINSDWPGHSWTPPWGESRLEVNGEVKNYWLSEVNKPRYLHYDQTAITNYRITGNPTIIPVLRKPVTTQFIQLENVTDWARIKIFNTKGVEVHKSMGKLVDVSGLSAGLYVLNIDNVHRVRFLKH